MPTNTEHHRELTQEEQNSIREYLLDGLSASEVEHLEQHFLTDAAYLEHLLIAEDELIDAYLNNRLTEYEKQKFSKHFLTVPALQQDVRLGKALRQRAAEHERAAVAQHFLGRLISRFKLVFQTPAVAFAMAALLLLAVCVGFWLNAQNRHLREEIRALKAQPSPVDPSGDLRNKLAQAEERGEQLSAELSKAEERRAQSEQKLERAMKELHEQNTPRASNPLAIPAFLLTIGGDRDSTGDAQTKIPWQRTGSVNLQVLTADRYSSYSAELETVEGRKLLTQKNLPFSRTSNGALVSIIINSRILQPNDYRITLRGKDASGEKVIGKYPFRILR